jgi:hypothetical protein
LDTAQYSVTQLGSGIISIQKQIGQNKKAGEIYFWILVPKKALEHQKKTQESEASDENATRQVLWGSLRLAVHRCEPAGYSGQAHDLGLCAALS